MIYWRQGRLGLGLGWDGMVWLLAGWLVGWLVVGRWPWLDSCSHSIWIVWCVGVWPQSSISVHVCTRVCLCSEESGVVVEYGGTGRRCDGWGGDGGWGMGTSLGMGIGMGMGGMGMGIGNWEIGCWIVNR